MPKFAAERRWFALDLFRALAVISMVQGHTFTALLAPSAYDPRWNTWHTLVHGLTAPIFLLGAGLAYGLVQGGGPGLRERIVRRALLLVVLGYALQIPRTSLADLAARPELVHAALRIGPLQLVGLCLGIAELLRARSSSRALPRLSLAAALTIGALSPFAWKLRMSGADAALGHWLDGHGGSLFPFFPWALFFFVGVAVVPLVQAGRARLGGRFGAVPFALGLAVAGATYLAFARGVRLSGLYGVHDFWVTNPLFVTFRLGLTFAWLGLLSLLEPLVRALYARVPSLKTLNDALASQSLVAYVVHLLLLYGNPLTRGLVHLGRTLTLAEGTLAFLAIMVVTAQCALFFHHYVATGVLRAALRHALWRMRAAQLSA